MRDTSSRRFAVTPGRLLGALLLAEAGLIFTGRRDVFDLPRANGWTSLSLLVLVGASLVTLCLWGAVAAVRRRGFQFGLRSLILLTAALAIPCAYLRADQERARRAYLATAALKAAKALVVYNKSDYWPNAVSGSRADAAPSWAAALLGNDCFRPDVKSVTFPQLRADFHTCKQLRELPGLEYLSLWGPGVTDERLAELRGLTRLETLLLNNTPITDHGVQHLRGLRRLSCLAIHGGRLTDEALGSLAGMTQLEYLYLTEGRITGSGLRHLRGLEQLQVLDLSNQPLTDAGLEAIAALTLLEELHLSGGRITGAGLAKLAPLVHLRVLSLGDNPLNDAGLARLPPLPELSVLHLPGTQITDAGLDAVAALPRLRRVDLRRTRVTAEGLEQGPIKFQVIRS